MPRLAIIPARGGSRRIPRKNIRAFCGKPILAYAIDAALTTRLFDDVMVSTDDAEIATVARSFGASVPFPRSAAASTDTAGLAEALLETLRAYGNAGASFETFCCILPTSPFLRVQWLQDAHRRFTERCLDSVLAVTRYSYPIWRALKADGERLQMIWPENYAARSQDLPAAFHDAGLFYWCRTAPFLTQKKIFMNLTDGIEIPESECQDIDTEEDWRHAELKFKILGRT